MSADTPNDASGGKARSRHAKGYRRSASGAAHAKRVAWGKREGQDNADRWFRLHPELKK